MGVSRVNFVGEIVGKTKPPNLVPKAINVMGGELGGILLGLVRILFRWQPKPVPPHRVQNAIVLHAVHPRQNIRCGSPPDVANM